MKPVLLDTGVLVALLDRAEQYHTKCVQVTSELEGVLVTCEAVIAESCYLLRRMKGAQQAVMENIAGGNIQVVYRVADRPRHLAKLLKKYSDVPMDLADACLVDMASIYRTGRILTLDRDFAVYRWDSKRSFELLVEL